MNVTYAANGRVIRGFNASDDFSIANVVRTVQLSAASTATITSNDASVLRATSASIRTINDVAYTAPLNRPRSNPTFTSSNGLLTIDSTGKVTSTADATSTITVYVPGMGARQITASVATSTAATNDTFQNYVTGSLGKHSADALAAMLSGKTAPTFNPSPVLRNTLSVTASSTIADMFANGTTGARNSGAWFAGVLDTTGISSPGSFNGAAISSRFLLCAYHYMGYVGATGTVYFTDAAGTVYSRGITAIARIGTTDIMLCQLDADLPAGIATYKLLPSTYATKLPSGYGYACVFTNQDRRLLAGTFVVSGGTVSVSGDAAWSYNRRVYDSGSPVFAIIGGQLVLLTGWQGSGGGPSYADNQTAIAAAIAASSTPGATFATADLSTFNSY